MPDARERGADEALDRARAGGRRAHWVEAGRMLQPSRLPPDAWVCIYISDAEADAIASQKASQVFRDATASNHLSVSHRPRKTPKITSAICHRCGETFYRERSTARYCSHACKLKVWRHRLKARVLHAGSNVIRAITRTP